MDPVHLPQKLYIMSVDKHGFFWFPQTTFFRSLVILSFKKLNTFSTIWSKKTVQISLCEKLERIAPFTSGGTCEKFMKILSQDFDKFLYL